MHPLPASDSGETQCRSEVGAYTTGENTLAAGWCDRLEPGMLVLADRGFCGFPLWQRAQATGTDLFVA